MTRAIRILRIERLVTDLRRSAAFYEQALGFTTSPPTSQQPPITPTTAKLPLAGEGRGPSCEARSRVARSGGKGEGSSPPKSPTPTRANTDHCAPSSPSPLWGGLGWWVSHGQGSKPKQPPSTPTQITLYRDAQTLVLISGGHQEHVAANDQSFQHIALPVEDMQAAYAHLQTFAPRLITQGGPVLLPPSSGSVTALKFYDPDGRPVEFLQFPDHRPGGIDHSAIVVTDAARSLAFYRDTLGLRLTTRQTNTGPEQDQLDGLTGTTVDVIALSPNSAPPHIELLAYRSPKVRPSNAPSCTRFVFEGAASTPPDHLQDPDGHALTLLPNE